MEACYGGTDAMERSCAVALGIDINTTATVQLQYNMGTSTSKYLYR